MIGRILCAIFGHGWSDSVIEFSNPIYKYKLVRCGRCKNWTLFQEEIDDSDAPLFI